jgi:hypothetical protein
MFLHFQESIRHSTSVFYLIKIDELSDAIHDGCLKTHRTMLILIQ